MVPILLACLSCLEFMSELSAPVHLQDWNVPSWKDWFQLNACDAVGRGSWLQRECEGCLESNELLASLEKQLWWHWVSA